MEDDCDLISIGPEKTYALIVGIDDYPELSHDWQLRNPVSEARQVARWLLERGVPASRIQCFLAQPATEATESLRDRDGQELQCHRPTMKLIQDALLDPPLPVLPEGGTLIFYWAGHGQLGRDSVQFLYDADCTDKILRVYDFKKIKRVLSSERWARLSRQILLVNACANWDTESNQSLQGASLKVSDKDLGNYFTRQQFVLYSSPPGEYAKDGEEGRPSPYFEKVFGVLQRLGDRGPFPADQFEQRMDETIEAMRPKPRTERIRFNCHSKEWYFDDDLTRLIHRWLSQTEVSMDRFQEIFRRWFDDQKGLPTSIAEVMRRLVSHPDPGRFHQMGGAVDFLLHVIEELDGEELGDELNTKLVDYITKKNSDVSSSPSPEYERPVLERVRKRVKEDRAAGRPPFYLSFYLTSGEDTAEFLYCIVHDGQFNKIGDHRMEIQRREKVEETFRKFYTKMIHPSLKEQPGFNAQDRDVHFRFYLPAEAMNQIPAHRFLDPRQDPEMVRIAQASPLTLSSYERATGKSHPDSHTKWQFHFDKKAHVAGTEATYRSIPRGLEYLSLKYAVEDDHWLGFDHPPTREVLDKVVRLGAPFLIWPWQATEQWPEVLEKLKELIRTTTLREAHTCLPRFRSKYSMETDQLVVFWDDYERNGLKHLQGEKFPLMFGE